MADGFNPASVLQRLHHITRNRHPAYALDIAARHRLLISDNRQRFHHRARIARRALLLQAAQPLKRARIDLEAPAFVGVHQLQRAVMPAGFERGEHVDQLVGR